MARLVVAMTVVLAAVACGGGTNQPTNSAPAAPTDTADGPGVIAGTITFEGTPPRARPVQMDSDPKCVPEPGDMYELLVVGPGQGLKNVFVYVKEGLGARTYAIPATPVMLDQKGCRYVPHVFGVQAGQTIQVANLDTTLHNVHAVPKANRGFNFGQPVGVPPVPRVFDQPEIGLPFRCDVHGWMISYVNVVSHPFFAVTSDAGSFEIKGLPPGTYTIELWHEQLGTQTQSVTVDGKAPATMTAAFKPPS
jgi:plastocyanin